MLPEAAIALDPARCVLHRARLEAATPHATVLRVREQAGPLQHAEVLVYSGEGDAEGLRQLRDGRFPRRQMRENRAPGRVGEGGKGCAQAVCGHL